jgi:hypothetical protein
MINAAVDAAQPAPVPGVVATEGELASRSIDQLVHVVRDEIQQARAAWSNALDHGMNAGDALIALQPKVLALSGAKWKAWLDENCSVAVSTAALYIQLARNRGQIEAQLRTNPELSLRGARQLISKSSSGEPVNGVGHDDHVGSDTEGHHDGDRGATDSTETDTAKPNNVKIENDDAAISAEARKAAYVASEAADGAIELDPDGADGEEHDHPDVRDQHNRDDGQPGAGDDQDHDDRGGDEQRDHSGDDLGAVAGAPTAMASAPVDEGGRKTTCVTEAVKPTILDLWREATSKERRAVLAGILEDVQVQELLDVLSVHLRNGLEARLLHLKGLQRSTNLTKLLKTALGSRSPADQITALGRMNEALTKEKLNGNDVHVRVPK